MKKTNTNTNAITNATATAKKPDIINDSPAALVALAGICGSVNLSGAATNNVLEKLLKVGADSYFNSKVDAAFEKMRGAADNTARIKITATLINSILSPLSAQGVKVTTKDFVVLTAAGSAEFWDAKHFEYIADSGKALAQYKTAVKRAIYSTVVGAFECRAEFDAAHDAQNAYNNATRIINGVKGKDGTYTTKPAAERINALKTKRGILAKTNENGMFDADIEKIDASIEKLENALAVDVEQLRLSAENAAAAYKKAVDGNNSYSVAIVGDIDAKKAGAVTVAKRILAKIRGTQSAQ